MTRPMAIVNMLCFLSTKPGMTGRPSDKRRGVTESWLSKRWTLLWTAKERILSGRSWCALRGIDCLLPSIRGEQLLSGGWSEGSRHSKINGVGKHARVRILADILKKYPKLSLTYRPSQRQDHLIPSIMWTPFSWILESPPPCQALS